MLLLLLLVAGVTNTLAQNVTVRGNNGSTIASVPQGSSDYDTFFKVGGFATWQHSQLSMVLTASDETTLTGDQLANPANNIFKSADGNKIQIGKGYNDYPTCYLTLSLPKGYRFTGYKIKFSRAKETKTLKTNSVTFNDDRATTRFGETNAQFNTYYRYEEISNGGSDLITRTEMNGDMGNVLYFKLENTSYNTTYRALITLESAEFEFTSEENYSTDLIASGTVSNVSAVNIPFNTSKVDYGNIERRKYNGVNRVSYSSSNVTDLTANFVLYEKESLKDGSDFDGISGKVVDYKTGSISSNGDYFVFNSPNKEQEYFIETPSYVTLSDNNKNPVGYRIVGASFDYALSSPQYYITYTYSGTKLYLQTNGDFGTNPVLWVLDNEGYLSTNDYYMGIDDDDWITSYSKKSQALQFEIVDGNIKQKNSTNYIFFHKDSRTDYWFYAGLGDYDPKATAEPQSGTSSTGYTLKVYDKTGTSAQPITVNASNPSGTVTLNDLNNDAVKFSIQGTGSVKVNLTLQALDPYLKSMNVICQSQTEQEVRMHQGFTADDFSVNGGEFYFYLPKDLVDIGDQVKITFEDLKSEYADETYEGGSSANKSRINFVMSDHYKAFGEEHPNVIYNDRDEASNAQEERLKVGTVGTKKFRFNNAEQVGTSGGTLTEYPFSLKNYSDSPNGGSFEEMIMEVSETDKQLTRYVFTTDETRYNIAPTTAVQHRSYAFYEMIVHVQSASYTPKVKFTKVYDKTLYRGNDGKVKKDAFYGVEVTAKDGQGKDGFSSTAAIHARIENILKNTKVDDFNNTDLPATAKQILYLDFSKLAGVYQITTDEHQSMEDFSATNAANCLVFLPKGASAPNNNVASATDSGIFDAANNIVLTDMQPFYSPYDIQVSSANMVEYKRLITKSTYGQETTCTVILPFNILVENGKHTNLDGSEFTLHKMQDENSLKLQNGTTYAYMPNAFSNVTTTTEQNKPFIVKLANVYSVDTLSFVVTQKGATIKATTGIMNSNYTISDKNAKGEVITSSGTATDGDAKGKYTFTNKGTYAGIEIPSTEEVFYFARNNFVCSKNLDTNIKTAKVAPFRTFYATQAGGAAKLMSFDMIFSEGLGDTPTGINSLGMNPDLKVVPGNGMITLTSTIEQNVSVHSTSGVMVNNTKLQAGETQTINVPAGVYVINGVKIIVK